MSLCKHYRLGCEMRDKTVKAKECRIGTTQCDMYEPPDPITIRTKSFRPHITQEEARYLTDLLLHTTTILDQYQEYFQELQLATWRLAKIQTFDPYTAYKEGFREKTSEMDQWRLSLSYLVFSHKKIQNALLEKYGNLANGVSDRGICKHFSHKVTSSLYPNCSETIPAILNKQLVPVTELGKKAPLEERLKQKASQA